MILQQTYKTNNTLRNVSEILNNTKFLAGN